MASIFSSSAPDPSPAIGGGFPHDDEGRPDGGMRIVILGSIVHESDYRATQRVRTSDHLITMHFGKDLIQQFGCGIGINGPMRNEQRARSGIKESTGQSGKRLRPETIA